MRAGPICTDVTSFRSPGNQSAVNHIIFVKNFFDDLWRKAPQSSK